MYNNASKDLGKLTAPSLASSRIAWKSSMPLPSGQAAGWWTAFEGWCGRQTALLANNSYEVAKFLLNESGRGLGDTAQTISDWLGGNKALAAFNAIAFGASRGLVDGIRGLVWSSGTAGKQLLRSGQVSAQRVGPRAG